MCTDVCCLLPLLHTNLFIHGEVINNLSDIIVFAKIQLEDFQPQDDYKALLELAIIFLGGGTLKEHSSKGYYIVLDGQERQFTLSKYIHSELNLNFLIKKNMEFVIVACLL
ncbi:hypothetical protein AVEN_168466-1 [Araneus ventricosus]|uniref:Uncharacterized protein n=1 Tax=Araneus ventricosus TaxID=182803 RepID=A0A4Y2SNW5_ARAVE|nr:hypothetical protein AVEN_168466-1 [Araneus ventricosus]